jgi:WD40 repeat protein
MQSSHSLQPLLTILKAHEFPPTTLRFSPTSNLLVSGSADNSVRVISVPAELGGQCEFWSYYFLYLKLIHLFVCSVGNLVSNHIDIDRFSVGYRVPKVAVIDRLAS